MKFIDQLLKSGRTLLNHLTILSIGLLAISVSESQAQVTRSLGDVAFTGLHVQDDNVQLVVFEDITAGETFFITDNTWNGTSFDVANNNEGFVRWVAPNMDAGDITELNILTLVSSSGGTMTTVQGGMNLQNASDGVFIYQTSNGLYNGTPTILGFIGNNISHAGTFSGTGISDGNYALLLGGKDGVYTGARSGLDKAGYLALIFNVSNWSVGGNATFIFTPFNVPGCTPVDVSNLSAEVDDAEVTLSWTNSACFSEVLVVAKANSAVTATPSGDGSSYTANATFGSGTNLGSSEYVVYKGTDSTVTISGLTNGTTYHFEVFTTSSSNWSSGVTTSAEPFTPRTYWYEPFDDNSQYTVTQGGEGNNGTGAYFQITDGSNINVSYSNTTGDFFAAQDIDNGGWSGSASPSQITWSNIFIEGFSSLTFDGSFASTGGIDADDSLYFEYRVDGGSWTKFLAFANDGGSNTNFLRDNDYNGIGDGTQLTSSFQSFAAIIAQTGSSLDIRLTLYLNDSGEDVAFDEFSLEGNYDGLVFFDGTWYPESPSGSTGGSDALVIQTSGTVTSNGEVNNVRVPAGFALTITNGADIIVNGDIENNGTITVNSGASISQTASSDGNSGTGTYVVVREGYNDSTDYNLWSSPVSSAALTTVFTGSNNCDMYAYDEVEQEWRYDFLAGSTYNCLGNTGTWPSSVLMTNGADGIMDVARGYLMPGSPSNTSKTFTGEINNGTYTFNVQETDSVTDPSFGGNDWNLVGNPYPGAVLVDNFLATNYNSGAGDITNAVYFYVRSGGSLTSGMYETYTTGDNAYIGSGQGFFVEAINDGTISFTNAMRGGENTTFRSSSSNPKVAYFHLEGNGLSDAFRVYIDANASDGVDYVYDISKMYNWSGFNAYTSIDDRDFVFQSIEPINFNQSKSIPLGFEIPTDGDYTLVLDSTRGDWNNIQLMLRDKQEQTLKLVSDLSAINLTSDSYKNRFDIVLKYVVGQAPNEGAVVTTPPISDATGVEEVSENQLVIIAKDKAAELVSDVNIQSYSLFDLSGRMIENKQVNDQSAQVHVQNNGAYIIRVKMQDNSVVTRKMVL